MFQCALVCRFKAFAHATIRGDETSKALQLFRRRALFLFAAALFPPSDNGKAASEMKRHAASLLRLILNL
jgi:hypothetical protein